MFLTNLFKFKKSCIHASITPDVESGYCPDCGKLIKNEWYITRCSCCGLKLKTVIIKDEVCPQFHYCSNCGGREYTVEKLNKINFVDINYAVLRKTETEDVLQAPNTIRYWQEKKVSQPKLLTQYL